MDIDFAHESSQRYLKQRNALAIVALVLSILLMVTFGVASTRNREVVLVPIARSPLTLNSSGVSKDYLEMVTRDVSEVALNRSPETLNYWMESLLNIADESQRGALKGALLKVVQEQSGSQISQFFTPDYMQVYPEKLESDVGGVLHTVAASKEVSTEHRQFRFTWSYNGISLKLKSFGMIQRVEPQQ